MAKLRPLDLLFCLLATLALGLLAFFLLVLSGTIAVEPSTGTAEPAQTPSPQATQPAPTLKAEPKPKPKLTTKRTAAAPTRKPKPAQLATVILTASRGDCWFQARADSATGRVLDERVLSRGQSISIKGKSIWLAVGAAGNLDVTLDGKPQQLSSGTISLVLGAKSSETS